MGQTELEPMTPTWTRFAAHTLGWVDWTDPDDAHKGVMRMFDPNLPGAAGHKRADSHILFRVDAVDGLPVVTVQSDISPVLVPEGSQKMVVPDHAWAAPAGSKVMFRVAVSPTKRTGDKERLVHTDEVPDWLRNRLGTALQLDEILNHARDTYKTRRRSIAIDTIDAVGTVLDAEAFHTLRLHGVGRNKSYGAGLLTAKVIG